MNISLLVAITTTICVPNLIPQGSVSIVERYAGSCGVSACSNWIRAFLGKTFHNVFLAAYATQSPVSYCELGFIVSCISLSVRCIIHYSCCLGR